MLPIEAETARAISARDANPALGDAPLSALQTRPRYWGWVEAAPLEGADIRMFLAGHDDGVALRLFWNRQYERMTLGLWTLLARSADLMVDAGAHTGVYSLAAWAAGPQGGVMSFEPHFMNYARLNLNLRSNGFPTRLSAPLALSDRDGMTPFSIDTSLDYHGSGGALGVRPGAAAFRVQACRLDGQLDAALWPRVSALKIDTEGHEDAVLEGARGVIDGARPDLFLECLDGAAGAKLTARLAKLGYRYYLIDDRTCTVEAAAAIAPEPGPDGAPASHRLNRLATRRSPSDVEGLVAETHRRLPGPAIQRDEFRIRR